MASETPLEAGPAFDPPSDVALQQLKCRGGGGVNLSDVVYPLCTVIGEGN